MDRILDQGARRTGDSMRLRFATNASCQVDIPSEAVQAGHLSSFGGVISELKPRGYGAPNRKYLLTSTIHISQPTRPFYSSCAVLPS